MQHRSLLWSLPLIVFGLHALPACSVEAKVGGFEDDSSGDNSSSSSSGASGGAGEELSSSGASPSSSSGGTVEESSVRAEHIVANDAGDVYMIHRDAQDGLHLSRYSADLDEKETWPLPAGVEATAMALNATQGGSIYLSARDRMLEIEYGGTMVAREPFVLPGQDGPSRIAGLAVASITGNGDLGAVAAVNSGDGEFSGTCYLVRFASAGVVANVNRAMDLGGADGECSKIVGNGHGDFVVEIDGWPGKSLKFHGRSGSSWTVSSSVVASALTVDRNGRVLARYGNTLRKYTSDGAIEWSAALEPENYIDALVTNDAGMALVVAKRPLFSSLFEVGADGAPSEPSEPTLGQGFYPTKLAYGAGQLYAVEVGRYPGGVVVLRK